MILRSSRRNETCAVVAFEPSKIAVHSSRVRVRTAAAIAELQLPLVVVDPVMVAKSGDRLLDGDAIAAISLRWHFNELKQKGEAL